MGWSSVRKCDQLKAIAPGLPLVSSREQEERAKDEREIIPLPLVSSKGLDRAIGKVRMTFYSL